MKTLLGLLMLATSLNTFAAGPVLTSDQSRMASVGPVFASIYEGRTRTLSVMYTGALRSHVKVGVVLNETLIGYADLQISRGNVQIGQFEIAQDASGDLELFFVDSNGNYDSNFGQNFEFTIE
jgi:hypothetical protein